MATSEEILKMIRSKNLTNINNTTYTNNTNNLHTTTIVSDESNSSRSEIKDLSVGLASLSASQQTTLASPRDSINFVGGSELPPAWLNFKWDLYKNPSTKQFKQQLKLKCNIIKQDGTKQALTASLNSPHTYIWRKVDTDNLSKHWELVKEELELWQSIWGKTDGFRASKFYLGKKQGSVEIAVFLREEPDEFLVRMFYRAKIYDYAIPKNSIEQLTVKQLASNQIATLRVGKQACGFVSLDDLGI
jgi:hypothetical protein